MYSMNTILASEATASILSDAISLSIVSDI